MNDQTNVVGFSLLRQPFAANQISRLPKPYKKDSPKGQCKECGGYHGLPAMHLDYVGHAALTDRLLDVDPQWTWEPLAFDAVGLPALDKDGGLWIKLTVLGVTRLGYGDAQNKSGGDAMKERIGDALRNAAMRFGCALDLWHKGILHLDEDTGEIDPPTKVDMPRSKSEPSAAQDQAAPKGQAKETEETGSHAPGPAPAAGPTNDKPMLPGQLKILRAKMANANPKLTDADLIAKFGPVEDLKFGMFAEIQTWTQGAA